MRPTVSIIVPTRNGGPEFCQLLERVTTQKGPQHPEIIVVDSGSSDGTPDVARRFGAKVVDVAPEAFNHGLTRNLGIQHSQGEICVLLVQDALPIADLWLEALLQPFDCDSLICGVTTRQFPRPGTDIVAQWEVVHHSNCLGNEVKIRSISDWGAFERLSLQDRLLLCNFDNVCSAIRRCAWERHPFRSLPFAEDLDWGVRILRAGNKIAYEPAAAVIHSHLRPAIYHLRRQYVSARVVPGILGCPVPGTFSTNDEGFLSVVNCLVKEAFSFLLLVDQLGGCINHAEWCRWLRYWEEAEAGFEHANGAPTLKRFAQLFARKAGNWLSAAIRANPMRAHFFFLMSQVTQGVSGLNAAALHHVIVHCLARTLGGYIGNYYLWSDQRGLVSPQLQALDDFLCVGV